MSRAFELLKQIVNLSLPRDVAGHPAVIEARELTGCGQAMGVKPLTRDETARLTAAMTEQAAATDRRFAALMEIAAERDLTAAEHEEMASLTFAPADDLDTRWPCATGRHNDCRGQAEVIRGELNRCPCECHKAPVAQQPGPVCRERVEPADLTDSEAELIRAGLARSSVEADAILAGEPFDLPPSVGEAALQATRERMAKLDRMADRVRRNP